MGIRSRPWAQVSSSSFPFHSTGRPFMRSLIIRQEASNSAIFTGCWPMTRRAESPRPIPSTARPPDSTCTAEIAAAVAAGWRVTGLVTPVASRSRVVAFADPTLEAMDSAPIEDPGTTPRPGLPGVQYVGIPQFQDVGNRCTEQFSSVIAGQTNIDAALSACQDIASQVGG